MCRETTAHGAVDTAAAHLCRDEVVVVVYATVYGVALVPSAPSAIRSNEVAVTVRADTRWLQWRRRRVGLRRWRNGRRSGRRDTWLGLGLRLGLGLGLMLGLMLGLVLGLGLGLGRAVASEPQ